MYLYSLLLNQWGRWTTLEEEMFFAENEVLQKLWRILEGNRWWNSPGSLNPKSCAAATGISEGRGWELWVNLKLHTQEIPTSLVKKKLFGPLSKQLRPYYTPSLLTTLSTHNVIFIFNLHMLNNELYITATKAPELSNIFIKHIEVINSNLFTV